MLRHMADLFGLARKLAALAGAAQGPAVPAPKRARTSNRSFSGFRGRLLWDSGTHGTAFKVMAPNGRFGYVPLKAVPMALRKPRAERKRRPVMVGARAAEVKS